MKYFICLFALLCVHSIALTCFFPSKFASIVFQAIGECNIHKVDATIASKYQAITESNDGLVFADFCFHTLLYQTPPQGYVFLAKLSEIYRTNFETWTFKCCQILQYWMSIRTFSCTIRSCYWKTTTKRRHTCIKKGSTKRLCNHVCTAKAHIHILVVECTACTMHLVFSWFNFLFNLFS